MRPIFMVQKDEYIALTCLSPTGAMYLVDGGSKVKLLTPKMREEFKIIDWDSRIAKNIAKQHNDRFDKLRIDLRKL